ncbi:MAG: EutN/CcmL family microcompartment protein [Planctomycetaceae bacterium]
MRIAEVIGKVTLSAMHPSLEGARWLVGVPLAAEGLKDRRKGRGEPIVIYDELSAGEGAIIAVSESAEASAPFHPEQKPINAYNAAILDAINL